MQRRWNPSTQPAHPRPRYAKTAGAVLGALSGMYTTYTALEQLNPTGSPMVQTVTTLLTLLTGAATGAQMGATLGEKIDHALLDDLVQRYTQETAWDDHSPSVFPDCTPTAGWGNDEEE